MRSVVPWTWGVYMMAGLVLLVTVAGRCLNKASQALWPFSDLFCIVFVFLGISFWNWCGRSVREQLHPWTKTAYEWYIRAVMSFCGFSTGHHSMTSFSPRLRTHPIALRFVVFCVRQIPFDIMNNVTSCWSQVRCLCWVIEGLHLLQFVSSVCVGFFDCSSESLSSLRFLDVMMGTVLQQ
jgi:hypothetical protein